MAEELYVYTGSAWKEVTEVYVYTGSAWKQVTEGYVYTGSAWKAFLLPPPTPPSFSYWALYRERPGGACAAEFCWSCTYWDIDDALSGDVVDIAYSQAGGTYVTWADDIAYDYGPEGSCTDYAGTGERQHAATAGCKRTIYTIQHRLTLFRSSVQQDEVFTGNAATCNSNSSGGA